MKHSAMQERHESYRQEGLNLILQAWLAALQHDISEPVILLIDLEDEFGRGLVDTRDKIGKRRPDYRSYIVERKAEGKRPLTAFPESRQVVKDWFDNMVPEVGTALTPLSSDKFFWIIILAAGGQSVVRMPTSELGIWIDPTEPEKVEIRRGIQASIDTLHGAPPISSDAQKQRWWKFWEK